MDLNYRYFIKAYKNNDFAKAGLLVFEILSLLPTQMNLMPDSWKHELSALFQFLHESHFEFRNEDDFYDILSTISSKMKAGPVSDWKSILS